MSKDDGEMVHKHIKRSPHSSEEKYKSQSAYIILYSREKPLSKGQKVLRTRI